MKNSENESNALRESAPERLAILLDVREEPPAKFTRTLSGTHPLAHQTCSMLYTVVRYARS